MIHPLLVPPSSGGWSQRIPPPPPKEPAESVVNLEKIPGAGEAGLRLQMAVIQGASPFLCPVQNLKHPP